MKLHPSENLTEDQVQEGLKLVIKDGLAVEAMTTLTGGAFLVAMALSMGATNFQIGFLAALPTIANIFQLVAIWLVQKYNNRRGIIVVCSLCARFPLLIIGILPFMFKAGTSVQVLICLLFFHHLFASVAGASWNSWMKDLVPGKILGSYFSHRSRLTQIINVTLSLVIALCLDYIKSNYPQYEMMAYPVMFLTGGVIGMLSVYLLASTPEPKSHLVNENIFKLLSRPLKDKNFRKFLVFNSFWAFSINLATPFIAVYLMRTVGLKLSYIIALTIISQVSSILFIRVWGKYTDRYSNKTIISICGPVYIFCILGWTFTGNPSVHTLTIPLLVLIQIFSGISTAGINLAMSNIGMKLAPKGEAIVYISARSMITSLFPAIAPLAGGLMADFFATHQLMWSVQWNSPAGMQVFHLLELKDWNFFFLIGAILATLSMRMLKYVKEEGEVEKKVVVELMIETLKNKRRENMSIQALRTFFDRADVLSVYTKKKIYLQYMRQLGVYLNMKNIAEKA